MLEYVFVIIRETKIITVRSYSWKLLRSLIQQLRHLLLLKEYRYWQEKRIYFCYELEYFSGSGTSSSTAGPDCNVCSDSEVDVGSKFNVSKQIKIEVWVDWQFFCDVPVLLSKFVVNSFAKKRPNIIFLKISFLFTCRYMKRSCRCCRSEYRYCFYRNHHGFWKSSCCRCFRNVWISSSC